jgi:hypothetical protein
MGREGHSSGAESPGEEIEAYIAAIQKRSAAEGRAYNKSASRVVLLGLLVKKDGNAEAGKSGGGCGVAGTDGGGVDLAGGETAVDIIGQLAEIAGFVAHDGGGTLASKAAFEFAGAAGIGGGGDIAESTSGELRGDLPLLLFEAGGGNSDGEVFHREIHVARLDDGDTDGVEFAVEKIGAVRCGVHPLRVEAGDAGTFSDVFRDEAETRTGMPSAILHGRFAWELVRESVVLGHEKSVLMRRGGEGAVPLERSEAGGGAIAIGGVKQREIGSALWSCRRGVERGSKQKRG